MDFDAKLQTWLEKCQLLIDNSGSFLKAQLEVMVGQRYVRIVKKDGSSRSAYAFIDKTNGDVLKAASWKAPAKHARGNIFDADNGMKFMGVYGPAYLR